MNYKKLFSLIGILIFIYIIYKIGLNNIINAFTTLNYYYILLAAPLIFAILILSCWKWQFILKNQGIDLGFYYLFKLNFIGFFYGFITPARTGSLIRAFYLKDKTKKSLMGCSSGIIIERALDLISVFLLATIGSLFLASKYDGLTTYIIIAFAVCVLILSFVMSKKSLYVFKLLHKYLLPGLFKEKAEDSFNEFYNSLPKFKNLIFPFILTLLTWVINYSFSYLIGLGFHFDIPYLQFITIFPIATVVGLIPITVSGLGTRELTLITIFEGFNASKEGLVGMSLVTLVIMSVMPALIGALVSIWWKDGKVKVYS